MQQWKHASRNTTMSHGVECTPWGHTAQQCKPKELHSFVRSKRLKALIKRYAERTAEHSLPAGVTKASGSLRAVSLGFHMAPILCCFTGVNPADLVNA